LAGREVCINICEILACSIFLDNHCARIQTSETQEPQRAPKHASASRSVHIVAEERIMARDATRTHGYGGADDRHIELIVVAEEVGVGLGMAEDGMRPAVVTADADLVANFVGDAADHAAVVKRDGNVGM
jgi:hypothetical protein